MRIINSQEFCQTAGWHALRGRGGTDDCIYVTIPLSEIPHPKVSDSRGNCEESIGRSPDNRAVIPGDVPDTTPEHPSAILPYDMR
jgi:hypothetical protein